MTRPHPTRREFLSAAAAAVAGVGLAGCAEEPEEQALECPEITIEGNHGHVLEIPIADVEAGETKTYTLEGTHTHTLDVDALVFEKLKTDGSHTLPTSNTDGHLHQIVLRLDPECLPDG